MWPTKQQKLSLPPSDEMRMCVYLCVCVCVCVCVCERERERERERGVIECISTEVMQKHLLDIFNTPCTIQHKINATCTYQVYLESLLGPKDSESKCDSKIVFIFGQLQARSKRYPTTQS